MIEVTITTLLLIKMVLVVAALGVALYAFLVLYSFRKDVPFVPTHRAIARRMAQVAQIRPGERVVDLGSGTGSLLIAAALTQPQALVTGYEETWLTRQFARLRTLLHPSVMRRISIHGGDFFTVSLAEYDVVLLFLTPDALRQLEPQFRTMRTGSRIVTYLFHRDAPGEFTEQVIDLPKHEHIYLYLKK